MAREAEELAGWLGERLYLARFKHKFLHKPFPVHSSFFLGEIALFSFVVLVLSGIYLALSYEPSTELVDLDGKQVPAAYASVVRSDGTGFGLIVRRVHNWAANFMIAAVILHLLRVFLTGAFKKPREINWLVGVLLLGVTIFAAFSGYLLPFSGFSVTATGIGYNIAKSIPWIGSYLADFVFAGKFPSPGLIPRFYFYHVVLMPLILISLISLHLLILLVQKHTQPAYARYLGESKIIGVPLWPQQAMLMAVLFLLLVGAVMLLAGFFPINPVEFYGPPGLVTPVVKPDWYLLWAYGALKLVPGWAKLELPGAVIGPEALGGILFVGLVLLTLLLVPFIDASSQPVHYVELPTEHPARTGLAVAGLVLFSVLSVAGYREELGLDVGLLQLLALLAPLLTGLVTYGVLRLRASPVRGPAVTTPPLHLRRLALIAGLLTLFLSLTLVGYAVQLGVDYGLTRIVAVPVLAGLIVYGLFRRLMRGDRSQRSG